MACFTTAATAMIPVLAADIDTDQIIPAQFVNVRGLKALCGALFANRRSAEADFVLNRPDMSTRAILLVGPNFGCGSSREAAAWALQAFGIRALIGTTFNETFASNCMQNGLLPVPLAEHDHAHLIAAYAQAADEVAHVDLRAECVTFGGRRYMFRIEPFARELLLKDQDELAYLVARRPRIEAFEARCSGAGAAQ